MELNSISKARNRKSKTRVGRGGKRGKTAGRGTKGQKARAGNKRRPEWRDIIKKIPKRRGYGKNRARTVVPSLPARALSLEAIAKKFKEGETVTVKALVKAGLVSKSGGKLPPVKVLGSGVAKKMQFEGIAASASAKTAIEKAGGSIK